MRKIRNIKIFLLIIFSSIKTITCLPKSKSNNFKKEFPINNGISLGENINLYDFIQNIHSNLSQCFDIINDTTILKKDFFYSNNFQKQICTKYAISQKYKEDIYFPKYFHKCFPLCNSCSSYSTNKTKMDCISCLKGFNLSNGNCYINRKYNKTKRKKELEVIFNTLNLNTKINSNNIIKKHMNGSTFYFKEKNKNDKRRKLLVESEYDDLANSIINRESQTLLTNDKTKCQYNFHIELSPYYTLAEICISKEKYFIENNRCVTSCTPQLEAILGYPVVEIKIGPSDLVTVCDCTFRCCKKYSNKLAKSLDRGYSDCSYHYFRRSDDGKCLNYAGKDYNNLKKKDTYLLAQDFVPCFFPIYNDLDEIEFYITGYERTIVGNNCLEKCPSDYIYYYDSTTSRCYKCPEHCTECNGVPTNTNGHCIQCESGFHIIYQGFCYDFCPLYLGEDSGSCRSCNSNEINIEGKCVLYQGDSHNYGDVANPSFKDGIVTNYFHKCIEYVGNKVYKKTSETENSLCVDSTCPYRYYDSLDGFCRMCPEGCTKCLIDNGIECTECDTENYYLKIGQCISRKCSFYTLIDGITVCYFDKCPEGFYYLENEVSDDKSARCYSSCTEGIDSYFATLYGTCVLYCRGDDDSFIISEDNLCIDKCTNNYPENFEGICENCARQGKYNHNGVCVRKDELFDEVYYVLSGAQNTKYGKVGSCYIIDDAGDYHPEHVISRQINPNLCPNDCPTGFNKYFDGNGEIVCKKCYQTCETCDHTGEIGNHKCTSCKNGYEFSKKFYGMCDKICKDGEYFYYDIERERHCTDACPDDMPYYSESGDDNDFSIECIANCIDNNQLLIINTYSCTRECPEGYNEYNNYCIEECPNYFGTIGDSNICYNCSKNNLFYYKGKCYDITNMPDETCIIQSDSSTNPIPGKFNDKTLHDCIELTEDGTGYLTGYFESVNKCSKVCPDDFYYDSHNKQCEQCSFDCSYCDETQCLTYSCPTGYHLYPLDDFFSKCGTFCPTDYPIIVAGSDNCNDMCLTDDENKLIVSGGNEYGYENYKCIAQKCKEYNLFFNPSNRVCYSPENIPVNTFYNTDLDHSVETDLSECLKQISDDEYFTGFFYSLSNCPIQCPDNFYYAGNNRCKKCHPLCKTCFAEGTNRENNCLTCLDSDRILNPYLYNCEKKCDGTFHYSELTKKIICDIQCPKNNYIDEDTGDCIPSCTKLIEGNYCVNQCSEGKIVFNKYCLENVEIPTIIIEKTTIVEKENTKTDSSDSSNNDENNEKMSLDSSENSKEDDNNKENNDKESQDNNKEDPSQTKTEKNSQKEIVQIIKIIENNFTQIINNNENNYKTNNGNISICEIYLNGSKINCGNSENILDLKECEEKLKNYYKNDYKFYLVQIDINEQIESENKKSFSSQSKYKIYRTNGEETNINEICKDTKIKIEKDLNLKANKNNEEIMKLLEEGINVFDINDPFFKDICYPYQDENGNDIPLKNRKEDYYQDTVVCIKGCEYSGININTSKVMCNCDADALMVSKDENDDSILGYLDDDNVNNFISKIASSETIEVVKCYERTFKKDNIKKNIGFWIYMGFLSLFLALLAGLLCYGYNSLNSYLLQFAKEKEVENEEEEKEEKIITTKKIIVSSSSNNIIEENLSSNPPKKVQNTSEEIISEGKAKTRNEKIRFGFDKNKLNEYHNLNVSNFGKGYKLSNKFDIESIDYNQTPKKLISKNQNNHENSNSNTSLDYNSRYNSQTSSINVVKKTSNQQFSGSKVELEPEGALLAANNFFDTCRIVKRPNNYSEEEKHYYENNITSNNYKSKYNENVNKRNSLNISAFFQPNKKVVKLPGFPQPEFEKEIFSDEEDNYRKNKKRSSYINNRKSSRSKYMEKDNPLNRHNMGTIVSNEFEDIDEKNDDSSCIDSEKSKNFNQKKLMKIQYDNETVYTRESNNKNNRYNNRNSTKKNLGKYYNSLIRTTELDNLGNQPITINKYYITNGSNEKEEFNKKGKKKLNFPNLEIINSEEKDLKKGNKNKNNKSNSKKYNEKIITVTTRRKSSKTNKTYKEGNINSELDTAEFEEVMLNDHRGFWGIFCSFLSNFQIYISICFSDNIYVPWIIRASICLFTLELFFTFTALIIKISQFEKRYESKQDIDIPYLIKYEFSNIMYTTLITKAMNFVAMYIFVHYPISKVIRDYAYQGDIYIRELKNALYKLKCKYYIFMIIFIILTLAQAYFISCFCAVYIGSVKEWIYSSLIAFTFNLILSFIFIFLAALFRSISICCQSWLLFMISNFFLSFS